MLLGAVLGAVVGVAAGVVALWTEASHEIALLEGFRNPVRLWRAVDQPLVRFAAVLAVAGFSFLGVALLAWSGGGGERRRY